MTYFKRGKKLLAGLLTFSVLISGSGFTSVAAEMTTEDNEIVVEETTEQITEKNDNGDVDLLSSYIEDGVYLNYLVVGNEIVATPGSQYVLADIGDGSLAMDSVKLTYMNEDTGVSYEADGDMIDGSSILFNMDFPETDGSAGIYRVKTIEVTVGGTGYVIDVETTGIDAVFGVDAYVESNPDAYFYEDEEETEDGCNHDGIEVLDADGKAISFDSIGDALEASETDSGNEQNSLLRSSAVNPNLVVVIDPGHGGSDPGAQGNGLSEKDLCLKIANYCKEKLLEYSHVEVYMTRTTDTYVGLSERVDFAESKNADVFLCIHINAGGGRGAEVFYPNGNYIPAIGTEGKELAQVIQDKLVALGLANRGIKIRNSENGSTYPDGSPQDYLNVIWRSKRAGFPAVLVEHGFIDSSDATNFLKDENKLKEMGYRDATAVAEYYGLSKDGSYGSKQTIADTIRDATLGEDNVDFTPIMNSPSTTVERMVAYYNSKAAYPDFYASTDAPDITTFCQIYYEEAVAEGIDPGVAFAQAMKETGFLKYGGDVQIGQFNFCGLGATGNGACGNSFANVRMGARAHIQHLKAYASVDVLVNDKVDPRFDYVTRGCATYVEYLGINENPFGKGWATSKNYGYSIVNDYMSQFCDVVKGNGNSTSGLKVSYSTHVQSYGWQNTKTNGVTSGTTGLGKRLEAIKINVSGAYDLGISYQTHVQTYGWQDWAFDGAIGGTTGKAKRLEAIRMKLTGSDADKFDVYYRVHAQTFGWLGWAKNGETAGTEGFAKRLEAIQIYVVPKGVSPKKGTYAVSYVQYGKSAKNASDAGLVNYQTHVQTYGDQSYVYDGSLAGTYGEKKRLEAIRINVNSEKLGVSGGITYRTHVQSYGWQDWVSDGDLSGTTGEAKRLEAVQIKLTGELEQKYDVYYRVHCQTYGWMGWAKNGQSAGTEGYAKRMESIQVVLVPKGEEAPNCSPAASITGPFAAK